MCLDFKDRTWILDLQRIKCSNDVISRIASAVSSRKRVDILAKAKALGVKVTNPKGRVQTEA
jgi:ribosomal protein L32E